MLRNKHFTEAHKSSLDPAGKNATTWTNFLKTFTIKENSKAGSHKIHQTP